MPDPYAAKGWPRSVASERRSQLDQYLTRLRQLGATQDELDGVADTWDDVDPDTGQQAFPPDWRTHLLAMSDHELVAMLREIRDEHRVGTVTEEEEAERAAERAYQRAYAEAQGRIGVNVRSLLAWVADDLARAQAVLDLEMQADTPRRTLVGPLHDRLGLPAPVWPQGPSEGPALSLVPPEPSTAHSDDQGRASGAAG